MLVKIVKIISQYSSGFFSFSSYTHRKVDEQRLDKLQRLFRLGGRIAGVVFCCAFYSVQIQAGGVPRFALDIPAQPLALSINTLSSQTETLVLFPYDLVDNRTSHAVHGQFTVREALDRMLIDTGLIGGLSEKGVLMILDPQSAENRIKRDEQMRTTKKSLVASLLGFLVGSGVSQGGSAQSSESVTEKPKPVLEEVMVTAQKRSERQLDVPMSITAISQDFLENANITSTGDLGQVVPGLTAVSNGLAFTPAIRGISSSGTSPGDETNVAVYLDDVYLGAPIAGLFEMKDIERIEVLKGPQGTLFGRNATGGAIRVVTKAPSFEPTAEVSAEYGFDFKALTVGGYASGPLSDKIAASFSGYYSKDDGYIDGVGAQLGGDTFSVTDDQGVRGKLMYDSGENFRLILAADSSEKSDDRMFNLVPRDHRNVNENTAGVILPNPYQLGASVEPIFDVDTWGASLTAQWDTDAVSIKSITAYREVEGLFQTDTDRTNITVASLYLKQEQETLSQELVLSGDINDSIGWLTGLYYYASEAGAPFFQSYGSGGDAPNGPVVFRFTSQVDTTALSAFGELNFSATDQLNFILGLRYGDEKKEYQYENSVGGVADESETWDSTTYRLVARYDLTDASNLYASYSTGFKSGVYNAYALPTTGPVEPEELDAFEIGYKGRVGGITLTAAAFAYNYNDIQVQGQTFLPDGTWVVSLSNAAEAEIRGFELTASGYLTDALSFNIGYSGLPSAKYSDYSGAQVLIPDDATGGTTNTVPYDATGSRIIRAPKSQFNTQLMYESALASGLLQLSLSYSYNDGFYWQPGNYTPEDSFSLVNAKVGWTAPGEHYKIWLAGENLTDEEYSVYTATTAVGIADAFAQPRQISVGVSAKF